MALALAALVGGCTPSLRGAPERLFPVTSDAAAVGRVATLDWYETYAAASGERKRELRDQIVLSRMYAIDLYYSQYEQALTQERQNVGFWSTIVNLGLTASAAAVPAAQTKTILAAAATGLTGAREAYDKDILIERTITILQQQMRARRKAVRGSITERLLHDVSGYPLERALSDVETYYRAGTITGALIDVSADVGNKLETERQIEEAVVTRFALNDAGRSIRAYWNASPNNKRHVIAWLKARGITISAPRFVRSQVYAIEQKELLDYLKRQGLMP